MNTQKTIADICNNPLNIKDVQTNVWKGQDGSYKGFVKFTNEQMGWRAATKILLGYIGQGLVTPADIISKWAPESENNVQAYVDTVCGDGFLHPNMPLRNLADFSHLMARMALVERGRLGNIAVIHEAIGIARKALTQQQSHGLFYLTEG